MKQPSFLFKLVAVLSSVLLASGFVAYSAGAWGWFAGDSTALEQPVEQPARGGMILPGSKSGVLVDPSELSASQLINVEPPSAFLGGSKTISIAPLVPPPPTQVSQPVTTDPPQSIKVGSKSPAIRPLISPPPPAPTPSTKAPPEPPF